MDKSTPKAVIRSKSKSKTDDKEKEVLRNQLARALADYDNLRKRVERERKDLEKVVSLRLILRLLAVLDTLESAQKHLKDSGLGLAISQFKKVLEEEGLAEIKPEAGDKFDPKVQEVVETIQASGPEGGKHGQVAETVLSGWKFKEGPVVRVAKVKVYGDLSAQAGKKEELEKEMARGDYM